MNNNSPRFVNGWLDSGLVVWNVMKFPYIGNFISQLTNIFQRGTHQILHVCGIKFYSYVTVLNVYLYRINLHSQDVIWRSFWDIAYENGRTVWMIVMILTKCWWSSIIWWIMMNQMADFQNEAWFSFHKGSSLGMLFGSAAMYTLLIEQWNISIMGIKGIR